MLQFDSVIKTSNKNIILDVKEKVLLNCNEEMISQMFVMLIENAIKYSVNEVDSEYANIYLSVKKVNRNVEIVIRNKADGLKVGDYSYLLDRFNRVDSSRNSKTSGNGIGLSVVTSIVSAHKGDVRCYSTDGEYIEIKISI